MTQSPYSTAYRQYLGELKQSRCWGTPALTSQGGRTSRRHCTTTTQSDQDAQPLLLAMPADRARTKESSPLPGLALVRPTTHLYPVAHLYPLLLNSNSSSTQKRLPMPMPLPIPTLIKMPPSSTLPLPRLILLKRLTALIRWHSSGQPFIAIHCCSRVAQAVRKRGCKYQCHFRFQRQ